MAENYVSGGETTALLAWEATYGTTSGGTFMPFGQGIEVNVTRSNNSERIHGVGSRNATAVIHKQYSGAITVSGALSNAYWLLGVLGANVDGGVSGAYTHTYTEADAVPSFTMKQSMEMGDTDFQAILKGCKVESCTITAAVNEALKFSLDCKYQTETLGTTKTAHLADVEPIFTFAHGSVELPDGTPIAAVQNVELTIKNNIESVYGVGSRIAVGMIGKQREYDFKITAAFLDYTDLLTYFMNGTNTATAPDAGSGTEIATLELTFTNDDGDILDINLTGVHLDEETLPQSAGELVKEDVTGMARACTNIIYTNDVQTAPAVA